MAERKRTAPKCAPVGEASGPLASPAAVSAAFRKRQEEKYRKKDPKSLENISKTLSTVSEVHKVSHMQEVYKNLYDEMRNLQQNNERLTKENANLIRDKNASQSEMAKCILQRSSIEGACRALQQQNRELREKYLAKSKEDDEKHKQTADDFKTAMNEISNSLEDNKRVNDGLLEDNINMRTQFVQISEATRIKDAELQNRRDQLDIERQRAEAIQKKLELELQAQKEIHAREMALFKHSAQKSDTNCTVLLETVKTLQGHVDVYRTKYQGFESTVTESAQVVESYKCKLENISKQLNTAKQETESLKSKYYDTMRALIDMTEVKRKQDLHLQSLDKKNEQLQKLCRQLQKERSSYLKLLKEHQIETATSSVYETSEAEEGKKTATPKVTHKEKELQLLKENLKAVQEELTRLSVEETDKTQINQTDAATCQSSGNDDNRKDTQNVQTLAVPEIEEEGSSLVVEVGSTESVASRRLEELERTSSENVLADSGTGSDTPDFETAAGSEIEETSSLVVETGSTESVVSQISSLVVETGSTASVVSQRPEESN